MAIECRANVGATAPAFARGSGDYGRKRSSFAEDGAPGGAILAAHAGTMMPEQHHPTDGAVVRAVLAGQSEFYRLLVRRHQDRIYRYAVHMVGSPDDAADIAQRAFVTGYRKLARCKDPDRVGAWLFRIAANGCKDFLKDRRRETVSLDDPDVIPIHGSGPGEQTERREIRRRVQEALAALPTDQREAFVLKHLDGHSYDEMATLLDASVSALKMRVKRAREALQQTLRVCL